MLLAASTQRTIGVAILALVFLGGVVYIFFNIRSAKAEVGSEIELAANRSPALLDEDLEGRRLDLALLGNLVMLTIIAIALPFYWLGEPGREDGRNADTARIFTNRGESIYTEGAQCVNCHGAGGAGGSVTTSLTDDDGAFVSPLIRSGATRLVAYGTTVRLTSMAATALVLFLVSRLPGAWIGACALSIGVLTEAVVARYLANSEVRHLASAAAPAGTPVTYREIWRFYVPLAWTSVVGLAAHPMVTFFMGHAMGSLDSLAVLPVINSLTFMLILLHNTHHLFTALVVWRFTAHCLLNT